MLVKDIGACKDCPIYMKFCSGNRDILMSHYIEPPCVYLNEEDDMEKEIGVMLRRIHPSHKDNSTNNDNNDQ